MLSATSQASDSAVFNDALQRAVNVAKHDHLVILATDYHGSDDDTHRHATQLARHNDVLATLVYDPLGASFPVFGEGDVTDASRQVALNVTRGFNQRFQQKFREHAEQIRSQLRSIRIPDLPICTHESIVSQLLAALGARR